MSIETRLQKCMLDQQLSEPLDDSERRDLESKLIWLQFNCKHENAYWFDQEHDEYDGDRIYDVIECPDCGMIWEEKCYGMMHTRHSREDYLEQRRDNNGPE